MSDFKMWLELHLNNDPAMPRDLGKEVKREGGSYTKCHGHSSMRFVTVPATAEDLVRSLINRYGSNPTTVVSKGVEAPFSWIVVHDIAKRHENPAKFAVDEYNRKMAEYREWKEKGRT